MDNIRPLLDRHFQSIVGDSEVHDRKWLLDFLAFAFETNLPYFRGESTTFLTPGESLLAFIEKEAVGKREHCG